MDQVKITPAQRDVLERILKSGNAWMPSGASQVAMARRMKDARLISWCGIGYVIAEAGRTAVQQGEMPPLPEPTAQPLARVTWKLKSNTGTTIEGSASDVTPERYGQMVAALHGNTDAEISRLQAANRELAEALAEFEAVDRAPTVHGAMPVALRKFREMARAALARHTTTQPEQPHVDR